MSHVTWKSVLTLIYIFSLLPVDAAQTCFFNFSEQCVGPCSLCQHLLLPIPLSLRHALSSSITRYLSHTPHTHSDYLHYMMPWARNVLPPAVQSTNLRNESAKESTAFLLGKGLQLVEGL
jgi:hypothetical protein